MVVMARTAWIRTGLCAVGAAAIIAALAPAFALADPTRISHAGTEGSYRLVAAPGATNSIGVAYVQDPNGLFDYVFSDSAGLITGLYVSCNALMATEIRCNGPFEDVAHTAIKVDAGDGNDTVTVARGPTAPPPAAAQRLYGGPGNDSITASAHTGAERITLLSGDAGNDRLSSEGGATLLGSTGVDKLFARNGARDFGINCGPGSNKREAGSRDRGDPEPRSC